MQSLLQCISILIILGLAHAMAVRAHDRTADVLPGTKRLSIEGDIAEQMVAGVDRFLLREIDRSVERRAGYWQRDLTSAERYDASIEQNRRRLSHILGVRDGRTPFSSLELVATTHQPAQVGRGPGYKIYAVRWPVLRRFHGEGLLLVPDNEKHILANVVAIPDADQTPEMIAGLVDGVPEASQFARRLAESGCRVVVPVLIDRRLQPRGGRALLTGREYLYRSAFELGRHLVGYEVQKVLAVADWFERDFQIQDPQSHVRNAAVGIIGWGEGGLLALYAGALDPRIDSVCVSGCFDSRRHIWQEPIDRNVFGLLEQFGGAELASMIAPRALTIEACRGPEIELPSSGGAPGRLITPDFREVQAETRRASELVQGLPNSLPIDVVGGGDGPFGSDEALHSFLVGVCHPGDRLVAMPPARQLLKPLGARPEYLREQFDWQARQERQVHELDDHNQWLLNESAYVRRDFMNIGLTRDDRKDGANKLDTSSIDKFEESIARFRDVFRREVIGQFDCELLPPNVRTRRSHDEAKWVGYEVVLNVFPDVIAYGILLLPKDLQPGEKRPVVVCQHGLEGRPQDVLQGDHRAYHDFAAKLAERGFITFAPQNLYLGKDRFRMLQRKANPLKKTLFSVMVPQHQQIVNWLKTLPQVDERRIAFYGLSYGGKSAMRIPPLVEDYCLSICSADFNEWVWKNASTRAPYSYVWTGEYEIFEFDLGSTFNYAEMAALIAPRPFMVERGHFDGVAPDEAVAYEFAKVRHFYAARLGIPDRCEIEWFVGPHTINGKGTFQFLHKHLDWKEP